MSHLDRYLDPRQSYGWQGTPNFKTGIEVLENGDEIRNADWIECRHSYTANFEFITKALYREIKRMFLVCRGMAFAFRFKDVLDYQAVDEIFAIGTGAAEYQLCKISVEDEVEYVRNVYAIPLSVPPVIKADGVVVPSSDYVVNYRTGKVLFDTDVDPGVVLSWSGEFDIWVRFATDSIPMSLDEPNGVYGSISVMEVPPPNEGFEP